MLCIKSVDYKSQTATLEDGKTVECVSIKQAAEMIGCSQMYVRRLLDSNTLEEVGMFPYRPGVSTLAVWISKASVEKKSHNYRPMDAEGDRTHQYTINLHPDIVERIVANQMTEQDADDIMRAIVEGVDLTEKRRKYNQSKRGE